MPPLPVINNTYRVTWNFQAHAGITPRIVQHFLSVGSNKEEIGEAISDAAQPGMFGCMHEGFEPLDIDVLPLDGTSTAQTTPLNPDDPLCEGAGQILPSSAYLLRIQTDQRGSQGRGRSFIGPSTEAVSEDGHAVLDTVAYMTGKWTDFWSVLVALDPVVLPGVASYVHEAFYPAQAFSISTILGTQRRRQNQLR